MNIVIFEDVESKIITIRNENVIIDSDIATLYGVETRDINKAVKNNPDKFPLGYYFEITKDEKEEVVENFHHLENIRFSPHLPKAFTEKGLYMLATIIKSKRASQTTISIIETFSKINNIARNIRELSSTQDEIKNKSLMQKTGEIFSELIDGNLHIDQTETTVEINFALVKVKHTVKRK